ARRAGELLLAAREALHGQTRRKTDRVRADLQPAVAKALGLDGEDGIEQLRAAVPPPPRADTRARAAPPPRAGGVRGAPRRSGLVRRLDPGGIRLEDGLLVADPTEDDAVEAAPPAEGGLGVGVLAA